MAASVEEQVLTAPVSPPLRNPLAALISMIRLGAGNFTLIKVRYDHPGQREAIIARLWNSPAGEKPGYGQLAQPRSQTAKISG